MSIGTVGQETRGGVDPMSIAEEFLAFEEDHLEARSEGFRIDNDDKAEWAVRKIKQAQQNIERRKAFVQAQIERLEAWQRMLDERDQATIDRMTAMLHPYFESLRPLLGKAKSYHLPSGTLQVRVTQVQLVRDDAKLIEAYRDAGLVKVKETPDWAAIKKRLKPVANLPGAAVVDTQTGEIVDGVTVAEVAGETFIVKVEVGE